MIRKFTKIAPALTTLALVAASFSACGERSDAAGTAAGGAAAPTANESIASESPDVIYAKGWMDLTINAWSADAVVGTTAHFTTTSNRCTKKAEGAFDLPTWNDLSTTLNKLATLTLLTTPKCSDSPDGSNFYNNGTAVLRLSATVKRTIYEYKNHEICSYVPDAALSASLMGIIEKVIKVSQNTDIGECNGHPI
jgi:hypothetical protein